MMDHIEHTGSPAAALGKALDSYAEWVNCNVDGKDVAVNGESGASLLHAVAEIRRHRCPGATQLMTNLLVEHTKLSTLLFEHQLKLVRGQRTEPLTKSDEFVRLIERQNVTILAMRSTCVTQRPFCILTTGPLPKTTAPQFTIQPVAVAEPGHPLV